jgi:hypothetical protein
MSEIAKSDIFFMVATGSAVIATVIGLIIGIYIINILKDIQRITKNLKMIQRFIKHVFLK